MNKSRNNNGKLQVKISKTSNRPALQKEEKSNQNSQAVKNCVALNDKRCEIKGGSQEMAVMVD